MKKTMCVLIAVLVVAGLTGCATTGAKSAECPSCHQELAAGTYCPKCEMVGGYSGTVHCDKCQKDIPAGKWCEACNRIMVSGTVSCCGKEVPKGTHCAKCNKYAGVKGVAYSSETKKPYSTAKKEPAAKGGDDASAKKCGGGCCKSGDGAKTDGGCKKSCEKK